MKRGASLGNYLAHYHPLSKGEVKFVGGGDHGVCETLICRPNTPGHQRRMRRIASLVQKWPGKKESPSRPIKSTIAAGISGWNSSAGSTTPATPIGRDLSTSNKYGSVVLSCMRCDEMILGKCESRGALPIRLLTMWQQPLWNVVGIAPSSTSEGKPTHT